jgi:hypothetical protein
MRDLRVYIGRPNVETPDGQAVFYSRRADGPVYRWRYEQEPGHWCYARVSLVNLSLSVFPVASWGTVPSALQSRLSEHYAE